MQVNYQVQRGWYNYLCKSNTKYKEDEIAIYASQLPSTKRMI